MKKLHILTAGILSAAMVSSASADVTMNYTGSTAFRSAFHTAVKSALTNCVFAYSDPSSLNSSNYAIFQGTISGHPELGTVTIRTSWSGSGTGIGDVAANNGAGNSIAFISGTTSMSSSGVASTPATDSGIAHVAMSDVYQASTPFNGTYNGVTYASLTNTNVGVVPFMFVASKSPLISGTNSGKLTNMTPQLFNAIWTNGSQALSMFTGDATNDGAVTVYATGRDSGSGTRMTTLAETGYGINKLVTQWAVTLSGSSVSQIQIWPTTGSGADSLNPGNGGYSSGGSVASALWADPSNVTTVDPDGNTIATNQNLVLVSYLGVGDGNTAIGKGAKQLTYSGVSFSSQNIYNGAYTFWGYEHMYNAGALDTNSNTIKTAIFNQLQANLGDGTAGLPMANMNVSRATDGSLVGP